jgi:hypothetical protein
VAICTISALAYFLWPRVKGNGWMALAMLPLGIIGTTIGEFGAGFPVFLALNSGMPTWLQWCVGSLTLVLSCVWIRVLAELTATAPEPTFSLLDTFTANFTFPVPAR